MTKKGKPLGIGVIGIGTMGVIHAECFAREEDASLTGYYNPTRAKAEALAKRLGGRVYDSVEQMLADPAIDAVSICSTQAHHRDQAVAAARAGKYVLCEKPLALTISEMDDIAAAVSSSGVKFVVAHQMRLHPVIAAVKAAMPRLGAVFAMHLEWAFRITATTGRCWGTYREGGFFMELGCHAADLARYFMGPIRNVSANTLRMNPARLTEDYTHALLQFESFASGSILVSANHRMDRQGLLTGRILGEKGRIEFTCNPYARTKNAAKLVLDRGKEVFLADVTEKPIRFAQPKSMFPVFKGFYDVYQREIRNFLDACRGRAEPFCTLEDGRSAVEVVLAVYDDQSRLTRNPNFTGNRQEYRGDQTSHPALISVSR